MDPRERRQEEEDLEIEERSEDMGPEDEIVDPDEELVDPDDDDSIGRPVQLRP
ncbi:MAG: hypothetical protein ACREJS_10845 [Candidatus Rokuibacteriota bacterium]